jgi:glycosyltransferase involved in cell wall biosynthesis
VANRCHAYYLRQADAVIYPPVDTEYFSKHPKICLHPSPGYYLVVSRLVPYKKVDLAIKACNQSGDRLIVVGHGSEETKLRRLAKSNITFMGQVSDDQLNCLYHHARALLFPQEEEFGIVAVEAQAAGLPVIAFSQGSAKEIIIDGQTGILFPHQTVETLIKAMATLKTHTWYDKTIKAHAYHFDRSQFQRQFKQFVEASWQNLK